jgi:hypothetical protein
VRCYIRIQGFLGIFANIQYSGFDLQFLERRDEMQGFYDATQLAETCDAWDSYVSESGLVQDDSGV